MKEIEILPLELRKLGLTEKEVQVYLSALKLGYSSVQKIAQDAKISRPTAYEIIKSLSKKDLLIETKSKSRRYFTAQSPDALLGILKRQKKELEEKEREFIRIIAALRNKYHLGDKRKIKFYKDKKGLEILMDDFLTTQNRKIHVLISNEKIWPCKKRLEAYRKIKNRLGEIEIKELCPKQYSSGKSDNYLNKKIFKQKLFEFSGNVIIYNKVVILAEQSIGISIEDRIIYNLIKSFFLYIWKN